MPELPEVHTITSDLKKHVLGAVVKKAEIKGSFSVSPSAGVFKKKLTGRKITDIHRVAKNIVLGLDSGEFLVIHLAMTGRLLFRKVGFKADQWERVIFTLEKDGKAGELRYTDLRMFGKVKLIDSAEYKILQNKYGPDPVTETFDHYRFLELIQNKRTNIKNALLDQTVISGIGNIYTNDALWMAKIHPETKTSDMSPPMAKNLLAAIREILNESISNRGSTLDDKMYVDIFGKQGEHQNYFRIYDKAECSRCYIPVKFMKLNGRGTYFCENCQLKTDQESLL